MQNPPLLLLNPHALLKLKPSHHSFYKLFILREKEGMEKENIGKEADPFNEFHVKPITGGLGFHKKSLHLGSNMKKAMKDSMDVELPHCVPMGLLDEKEPASAKALNEILASFDQVEASASRNGQMNPSTSAPLSGRGPLSDRGPLVSNSSEIRSFAQPLWPSMEEATPRANMMTPKMTPKKAMFTPMSPAHSTTSSTVPATSITPVASSASTAMPLKAIPLSLSSLTLDIMVGGAISLAFLLCFLTVNEFNSMQFMLNIPWNFNIHLAMGAMCIGAFTIYSVLTRSYFGCTLGEWTFDCQLGHEKQMKKAYYPLLVFWRSIVVVISLFMLPLLSLLIRKDMTYYLTGLQLYRHC